MYAVLPLAPTAFELLFAPLANHGRSFSFPCDESGRVDIDVLSERARDNYFYARGTLGREFAWPLVRARL
jgi:hypothetical protein